MSGFKEKSIGVFGQIKSFGCRSFDRVFVGSNPGEHRFFTKNSATGVTILKYWIVF